MPNDWFQFKQFIIRQDKCAMKVSTDACIQGAWAAKEWHQVAKAGCRILDIGAGTGLLTLMLAQAMPDAHSDAIEINEDAYLQAVSNFEAADWTQHLNALHASLADFVSVAENAAKYDLIICNPPFFHNHLESQSKARNDARHSQSLSKEELATALSRLLKDNGVCCVMFPETEWGNWLHIARAKELHLSKQLNVSPTPTSGPNRIIGLISKKEIKVPIEDKLIIYNTDKSYTEAMKLLLKDYYLAF